MSEYLWFLGTGAAVATADRDNTALLVSCREKRLLIDSPGCLVRKLRLLRIEPETVDAVLITHTHTDHVYGLPSLVHSLARREVRIPVYGSAETIDLSRRLLDLFRLLDEKVRCRVDFHPLRDGDVFEPVDGISGRALAVTHRSSSLAFDLRMQACGRRLVYSGDTAIHPPLFDSARGCDLLIHDCSVPDRLLKENPHLPTLHTDALNLGKWAERAEIRRLAPVHLAVDLGFSADEIKREIRRHFTGELVLPSDLMRIQI